MLFLICFFCFFFFQAEDGIRDRTVTGVQTCALPILGRPRKRTSGGYNIYAAMRGSLRITEGKSELVGELDVVPPYVPHSVESEHPSIKIGRASCRERG